MVTIKNITDCINTYIAGDVEDERIYNLLLPVIIENDGKRINKIFERKIQKILPDTKISYCCSMAHIKILKPAPEYCPEYLISYNGIVTLSVFEKNTWCQEKHHHRTEQNRNISKETIFLYKKHLNAVVAAAAFFDSTNIPAEFSLKRLIPYELKKRN